MIVDVHCHLPTHRNVVPDEEMVVNHSWRPDRPVVATTTEENFRSVQENAGVDVSIVFDIAVDSPLESTGLPAHEGNVNDKTARFVADDPTRRIGFLSVQPEHPDALEELERSVEDLNLKGIKLGANYQRFDPLGVAAHRVYAEAERRGLPIVFHQGTSAIPGAPLRSTYPMVMDEIAMCHPELRIVMAHLGHPWQTDTIVVVRKHPHVYADVSAGYFRTWAFYNAMRTAFEWGVMSKLLFASDYPIGLAGETMTGMRAVNDLTVGTALPTVPLEQIEGIIHRNALELLGIG